MFRNEKAGYSEEVGVVIGEVGERGNIDTLAIGDERIEVGDGVSVFVVCGGVELENGGAEIVVWL